MSNCTAIVCLCHDKDKEILKLKEVLTFYAEGKHLDNQRLHEDSIRMTQQGLVETGWRARLALKELAK